MNYRLLGVGLTSVAVLVCGATGAHAAKKATATTKVERTIAKAAISLLEVDASVVSESTAPVVTVQAAAAPTNWICPVPGAKFTNDYGSPRSGGRSHAGTDMLAPLGTPILAPISGIVRHDTSRLGGLSFYLDSPDGLRLFGAHLSSFGAQGQVGAGTVIGYVGDSGNAKGTPHLHLEVHPTKKTKINPFPILKQVC